MYGSVENLEHRLLFLWNRLYHSYYSTRLYQLFRPPHRFPVR